MRFPEYLSVFLFFFYHELANTATLISSANVSQKHLECYDRAWSLLVQVWGKSNHSTASAAEKLHSPVTFCHVCLFVASFHWSLFPRLFLCWHCCGFGRTASELQPPAPASGREAALARCSRPQRQGLDSLEVCSAVSSLLLLSALTTSEISLSHAAVPMETSAKSFGWLLIKVSKCPSSFKGPEERAATGGPWSRGTCSKTCPGGLSLGLVGDFASFSYRGWKGRNLPESAVSPFPATPQCAAKRPLRDMKSHFVSLVLGGQQWHFQVWHLGWYSVCKQGWIISLRTPSDSLQHIQEEKMFCLWPWQSFSVFEVHLSDLQTHTHEAGCVCDLSCHCCSC